jgi:hypothetical protein
LQEETNNNLGGNDLTRTQNKRAYNGARCTDVFGYREYETNPVTLKDGRVRARIRVDKPLTKERVKIGTKRNGEDAFELCVDARSEEELKERIRTEEDGITRTLNTMALENIRAMKAPFDNFENYIHVKEYELRSEWLGKYNEFMMLWQKELAEEFSDLQVTTVSYEIIDNHMERITHQKKDKRKLSEQSEKLWVIIGDILNLAVNDGVIPVNPIKDRISGYRKSVTGVMSKNLAATTLTEKEQKEIAAFCVEQMYGNGGDNCMCYGAVLFRLITGIHPFTLCGLNIGDSLCLSATKFINSNFPGYNG